MLSSLPKLLDKNFVIGFFLPALLGLMLVAWTFTPLPILEPLRNIAASDKKLTDLTYIILIVSLLAIALLTSNNLQYRMLEGYVPPLSWCIFLSRWQRHRFNCLKAKIDPLEQKLRTGGLTHEESLKLAPLRRRLLACFPASIEQVLPTRFGNTIRAFEVYPFTVYGADGVPVWSRLAAVISKDFAAQVEDARSRVDCLVNITFLATLIAFMALGIALWNANWALHRADAFFGAPNGARLFQFGLGELVLGYLSYRWAIVQAATWGEIVKSAFDCFLPGLIRQLGYRVPDLEAERRRFWSDFNRRVVYQYPMRGEWPVGPQDAAAQGTKNSIGGSTGVGDDEAGEGE